MSLSRKEVEQESRALLYRLALSARHSTWTLLAASLCLMLCAGYFYSQIIPALDALNIVTVDDRLRTLRLLCVLGTCLAVPAALYSAWLLTGRSLVVDDPHSPDDSAGQ